jgi:hypothetical protein
MEYVIDSKGARIAIPDAVISASTSTAIEVKHGDKKQASAGVTVTHHKRELVERYIAADAKGREKIEQDAIAQLDAYAAAEKKKREQDEDGGTATAAAGPTSTVSATT